MQLTVQERGINKLSDTDYEQLRELFNDTDVSYMGLFFNLNLTIYF